METKFQTSFIPKKPLISNESTRVHAPTSILMIIGVIVFLASIGGAAFTFFAKGYLEKSQESLRVDLAANEKRFNVPLIEELKKANTKIELANQFLKNHVAVSEAFTILSALTVEKVRFSSLSFTASIPTTVAGAPLGAPSFKVQMKGLADSFNSIAFQSDVFSRSAKYGTNKVVKNPILADLTVDTEGLVNFVFSSELSLDDISYIKMLQDDEIIAGTTTPTN